MTAAAQKTSVSVHDLVYIPDKSMLVIACSDNTIYMYEEELTAGGIHRTYTLVGSIFEHFLQVSGAQRGGGYWRSHTQPTLTKISVKKPNQADVGQ